jgi:hypothetical protein
VVGLKVYGESRVLESVARESYVCSFRLAIWCHNSLLYLVNIKGNILRGGE